MRLADIVIDWMRTTYEDAIIKELVYDRTAPKSDRAIVFTRFGELFISEKQGSVRISTYPSTETKFFASDPEFFNKLKTQCDEIWAVKLAKIAQIVNAMEADEATDIEKICKTVNEMDANETP